MRRGDRIHQDGRPGGLGRFLLVAGCGADKRLRLILMRPACAVPSKGPPERRHRRSRLGDAPIRALALGLPSAGPPLGRPRRILR